MTIEAPALSSSAQGFLDRANAMLIGEDWVGSDAADPLTPLDPATGEVLGVVAAGDETHVDRAVAAARSAFGASVSS